MDQEDETVVVGWAGVWVTALVSFAQFLFFYAFFLRQRAQEKSKQSYDLYEPRQNTLSHRSPDPYASNWYKNALSISEEETLRCVGLDSFMFLRLLRLGARLSGLGSVIAALLIPIYATGEARGNDTEQFNQLTLARVGPDSTRLWATIFAWWIFIAFLLIEFWKEWTLFAKNRAEFLAKGSSDMPVEYRYAIRVEQVPPSLRTDQQLKTYFERLFPQKVMEATVYKNIAALEKLVSEREKNILALEAAVAFTKAKPLKDRPRIKTNAMLGFIGGTKVDAIEHYEEAINRLNNEIDAARSVLAAKDTDDAAALDVSQEVSIDDTKQEEHSGSSPMSSTAFVTFTSLRAKQAAVQCELTGNPDSMVIFPAADPSGILWNNITVPLTRQKILQLQAAALWCAGILFWAVPVSFVTSIANLNSIIQAFGLEPADPTVFWYGLVSGLLPVIALAILMAVLYMSITAAAASFIRYKSNAEVDSYAMYWHQLFQFANLWLILIGGSAFNQIDAIIKDFSFSSVVEIIVTAMPGASVFFVNMISVGSMGACGLELSMLPTYGVTLIMKLIQPESMRTQRQLDDAKNPPSMVWGQSIPPIIFIFLVINIYCTIVPIIQVFAFVYFSSMYTTWKHQLLHVYAQQSEGGGEATWQSIFGFLMACVYIAEVIFIAYMGLKEAPVHSALGFVPVAVTVLFHLALYRNIIKPLRNLPLEVAANVDIDLGELDCTNKENSSFSDAGPVKLYEQPALDYAVDERGPMPYRRDEPAQDVTDALKEEGV